MKEKCRILAGTIQNPGLSWQVGILVWGGGVRYFTTNVFAYMCTHVRVHISMSKVYVHIFDNLAVNTDLGWGGACLYFARVFVFVYICMYMYTWTRVKYMFIYLIIQPLVRIWYMKEFEHNSLTYLCIHTRVCIYAYVWGKYVYIYFTHVHMYVRVHIFACIHTNISITCL